MFLKIHAKKPVCAQKIDDVKMHVKCLHVHTRRYCAAMCIMVCTNSMHAYFICTSYTHAFLLACTARVHFGRMGTHDTLRVFHWHALWFAIYTVIHSKPNTCVRTYYYTTESIRTFYKFRAGNVNCNTFFRIN